jgi:hypothetical protein
VDDDGNHAGISKDQPPQASLKPVLGCWFETSFGRLHASSETSTFGGVPQSTSALTSLSGTTTHLFKSAAISASM